MTANPARPSARPLAGGSPQRAQLRRFLAVSGFTLFATTVASAFLMPLVYMVATSFKDSNQTSTPGAVPVAG